MPIHRLWLLHYRRLQDVWRNLLRVKQRRVLDLGGLVWLSVHFTKVYLVSCTRQSLLQTDLWNPSHALNGTRIDYVRCYLESDDVSDLDLWSALL